LGHQSRFEAPRPAVVLPDAPVIGHLLDSFIFILHFDGGWHSEKQVRNINEHSGSAHSILYFLMNGNLLPGRTRHFVERWYHIGAFPRTGAILAGFAMKRNAARK